MTGGKYMNKELLAFVKISNEEIAENKAQKIKQQKRARKINRIKGIFGTIFGTMFALGFMMLPGLIESMFQYNGKERKIMNNRKEILFENMAQYIFEQLASACWSEEEIQRIFIDELGFTNEEYKQEIGEGGELNEQRTINFCKNQ